MFFWCLTFSYRNCSFRKPGHFGGVFYRATGLFDNKEKKHFCYFECFGVVKVAQFGLVEPEVSKMKYFCSKKIIDVR